MSSSSSSDSRQDRILITASERESETLKLTLDLYSINFQAKGYAFFSTRELERGLAELSEFPLAKECSQLLAGGHFNESGSDLEVEHLSLRVCKVGNAGNLILSAKVFFPDEEYGEAGYGKGGRCDYRLSYAGLATMTALFKEVIDGSSSEADFSDFC